MQARGVSLAFWAQVFLAAVCVAVMTTGALAGTWVSVSRDGTAAPNLAAVPQAPTVAVMARSDSSLEVAVDVSGLALTPRSTSSGDFVEVNWPDSPTAGEIGHFALPVVRKLFVTRVGATVEADAAAVGSDAVIALEQEGPSGLVMPVQPPVEEVGPSPDTALCYEPEAYAADEWLPAQRVSISKAGIVRGWQLCLLEVRPVAYNPVAGQLQVWSHLDVSIRFRGGQEAGRPGPYAPLDAVVLNPPASSPTSRGSGNFLILTPEDFAGSAPLTQFEAAKTAQGYNVMTYVVPIGMRGLLIKAYIQSLWGTEDAPDYLLILGTADWHSYVATSNHIPIWVGAGSATGDRTDLMYSCMDEGTEEEWQSDFPYARWPVNTVSELQSVVDKTLYVEDGNFADPSYAERAVFLGGTDPPYVEDLHNWVVDTYMQPNRMESTKLYTVTYGADTDDVRDAFDAGCSLGVYFGHSGHLEWGTPHFAVDDIATLSNTGMYPFVITFGCTSCCFYRPEYDSSPGQTWLRSVDKGASATLGYTSSLSPHTFDDWANYYKFLMASIYDDGIRELGPARQAADLRMIEFYGPSDTVCRDFAELFALFADPSMALVEPPPDNYLIVVPQGYAGTTPMNKFVNSKEGQGFNVIIYQVPSGTSNTAIRSYIQSLWGTDDAPDYILLVGDTAGSTSTATTIPHWVGSGSRNATTDLPYACMDAGDDWYPEVPIGRFSASSLTELEYMMEKTQIVEKAQFSDPDYIKRGAFLATDDSNAQAEQNHDWVIENYLEPAGYSGTKIYANQGGDTQDVTDAVNDGSMFVVYMGHSTESGWWAPDYDQSDVEGLSNAGLYGLVVGWSCNSAHYDYPECFGETWVRKDKAGAAAYLSASNYVWWGSVEAWESSRRMERYFFQSIFEDNIWRVGPAWQAALYRILADPDFGPTHDHTRNIFEEFVLLGDPSLQLPRVVAFTFSILPEAYSACYPPDDEVVYTVSVGATGGFHEAVTLDVTGEPAGASVDVSNNGQIPPFISMVTIGNLGACTPGTYEISINGTGTGAPPVTEIVDLRLANGVPGNVSLSLPFNGAIDVSRTPELIWSAASQAAEYDVQIATDALFTNVVYEETVSDNSHTVTTQLDNYTEYHWRVRAINGCGEGDYSAAFSFTTIDQPDYFTEEFAGGGDSFDLENFAILLTPDGSGSYYSICGWGIAELPTDPSGGTTLSISEDSWATRTLTGGKQVQLYGVSYSTVYINDNGNITFNGGDGTWQWDLAAHFDDPRISPVFDDFSVDNSGTVKWEQLADRAVVSYVDVPQYNSSDKNTFQVEMFFTGEIRISWLNVDSTASIVGLSAGTYPPDFLESDLSAAGPCVLTGACCVDETCSVVTETQCLMAQGDYLGDETDCDPNPCADYMSGCVIISEVVDACLSGGCPKWIEITNTGVTDFSFFEGGIIIQEDDSSDVVVDVKLSGVTIGAGQSYVVNSNHDGVCTGAFSGIYGFDADFTTNTEFGDGNDRYIITDTADGSNLLDIYGQFGVSSGPWLYTEGYSYRLPAYNSGSGGSFDADEWFIGGVGSLDGADPYALLLSNTDPAVHTYDDSCSWPGDCDFDTDVDLLDYQDFRTCLSGPGGGLGAECDCFDLDDSGDVDLVDFCLFQEAFRD